MGVFDHFPYTNFHELNLMWILKALKEIQTTTEQFVAINSLKYADPIQWNIVEQYEKNTIVIDPLTGTAYISVQAVPSGVTITNTDYWSVVFNLEQFVTKANGNFTLRIEEQTTLTATFATPLNGWVVWGGVLYKALTNIIAGDQYVVDSNISRITVEDIIGHIEDLQTTAKNNVVEAINELVTNIGDLNDLTTADKINLVAAINELVAHIGDLDDLTTADKSNLVAAINEIAAQVLGKIGDLDDLTTADKSNLVAAINELVTNTGDLNDLTTIDKSNLVAAINEIAAEVLGKIGDLDDLTTIDKSNLVAAVNEVKSDIITPYHYYTDGYPRDWVVVNSQEDFDEFLARFNNGYSSSSCYIDTPGTYKITGGDTQFPVFNAVQMHIQPRVNGVTIDLNSATFYTSHINIAPYDATHRVNITNTNIDHNTRPSYPEGGTTWFTHCDFDCSMSFYGGFTVLNDCKWTSYDTGRGVCIDMFGGNTYLIGCDFSAITSFNSNADSFFGYSYGAQMTVVGRLTFSHGTNGNVFRARSGGSMFLYNNASWYDADNTRSFSSSDIGGYSSFCGGTPNMTIFSVAASTTMFYMTATNPTSNIGFVDLKSSFDRTLPPDEYSVRTTSGNVLQTYVGGAWTPITENVRYHNNVLQYYDGTNWIAVPLS